MMHNTMVDGHTSKDLAVGLDSELLEVPFLVGVDKDTAIDQGMVVVQGMVIDQDRAVDQGTAVAPVAYT